MAWQKVPQEHVGLLERALASIPEAEPRQMFGCPVWFVNGYMLAGAHQDAIFLRLPPEDQEVAEGARCPCLRAHARPRDA